MRGGWVGFAVVVVVCVWGCSKPSGTRPLAPATGVVTFKGKPMENARVAFHLTDAAAEFSYGVTDAEGKFKMSTYGVNDGAIVGKHKVTISKVDLPAVKVDAKETVMKGDYVASMPGYEAMMGIGGKKAVVPKEELPAKYSDPKTSQIVVEVKTDAASNTYKFDLD